MILSNSFGGDHQSPKNEETSRASGLNPVVFLVCKKISPFLDDKSLRSQQKWANWLWTGKIMRGKLWWMYLVFY